MRAHTLKKWLQVACMLLRFAGSPSSPLNKRPPGSHPEGVAARCLVFAALDRRREGTDGETSRRREDSRGWARASRAPGTDSRSTGDGRRARHPS